MWSYKLTEQFNYLQQTQNTQSTLKEKNHLGREKRKKKLRDSLIHTGSSVYLFFNRIVLTATASKGLHARSEKWRQTLRAIIFSCWVTAEPGEKMLMLPSFLFFWLDSSSPAIHGCQVSHCSVWIPVNPFGNKPPSLSCFTSTTHPPPTPWAIPSPTGTTWRASLTLLLYLTFKLSLLNHQSE